ncbi:MAG: ATP-binding cassette domain-containing protein [Eubacterium sp.]|nr:ATP-binding cassette domain-containing protein [Eubacterium sp.]
MKLEVKDLHKSFDGKEVLKGVHFSVESGRALGLLGRNGAGKTTSIRIIMDIFHADEGEVLLDGKPFAPSKKQVGYLPEERGMYPKKTVLDQMVYFAKLRGFDKKKAVENSQKWLRRLQVIEYEKRKMDTLSKGNQQKVQLAATLVCNPDIIVLDEPFSGLDPVNSQILKDVIEELIAVGKIVIFSSHQMSYVEEFCEDIAIINQGEVVLSGSLDTIKEEYGSGRKILSAQNLSLDELQQCCTDTLSDVLVIEGRNKHSLIFRLKDGAEQWDVLNRIREVGIDIGTYGCFEPSLNDIFVACVGDENHTDEEGGRVR